MWKLLLGLAFVACVLGSPFGDPEHRIVGGFNARPGQFPHQVSLQNGYNHFCGGSIISARYILTAAHCLVGQQASRVTVVTGMTYLSQGGQRYQSRRLVVHQGYNPNNMRNDIALIEVATPISFNSNVQAIYLPSSNIGGGSTVTLSGWGSTRLGSPAPDNLQYANLRTITVNECASGLAGIGYIDANQVCTFTQYGQGACHGDSGGPLISGNVQIGVVSWGQPCAVGKPDVFTRVYSYVDWIMANAV